MENEKIESKTFFRNYGIFITILLVIFVVLIYSIKISRNSWQNNLQTTVQNVLSEKYDDEWTVGDFVKIYNPLGTNAACYKIKNKDGINGKAVIIRIATYYGPVSAVYTSTGEKEITFVGFSSLHGKIADTMMNNKADKKIQYWQDKIPDIIK